MRPAHRLADAVLPVGASGDDRPRGYPEPVGLDRLPHIDVRMADAQHMRTSGELIGDAGLFRARHEVVDEHAEPPIRTGFELLDDACEVVDAAEIFDRNALDP